MNNAISDYQKWKQQGESLRLQAKQAMETRFRDLLLEAAHLAHEYRSDFGSKPKPPPQITAFRFKAGSKTSVRKPAKPPAPKADPKILEFQKRLAQTNKKLEAAKAAGKPTKNLEDKVYE